MPSTFPTTNDVFTEPSAPETTPLSSAGTGSKNHLEHHRDLGDAIEALETNVALKTHDHSGTEARPTSKLLQTNTHQSPDTDIGPTSLHHTLGTGVNQAARGNHTHDYNSASITGQPYIICTSTTRPAAPWYGMQIYETNTNRVRVWAQWPTDVAPRWVLLPVADVPSIRLLQGTRQQIYPAGTQIEFRIEEEDSFGNFNSVTSMTDIVISEPGLYSIDAAVAWNNTDLFSDNAMTVITLNGQETTRKNWEFVRGNFFTPGFPQSVPVSAKLRFATGDRLGLKAKHNGFNWQWSYSNTSDKMDTRMDVLYLKP